MTLVLYNGVVHTMDPACPRAQAVAMADGRILAVGTAREVISIAGPKAEVIDLHGCPVLPGLADAHIHFLSFALELSLPNLDGAGSLREALERLRPAIAATPPGRWVLGAGWNHEAWDIPRFPSRHDLDAIAPHHPVALRRKDGHSVWVNSRALELAGITASTPNPPGGAIDRDEGGQPTGILRESAMDLIYAIIPRPDAADYNRALPLGIARAHSLGITSIHDMEGPEALACFQEAHAQGRLPLRVTMQIPAEGLDHALALGLRTGFGDATLRLGAVKLFADGSLGSQTAWMLEPYEGQGNNYGLATMPPTELATAIGKAIAGGIACAVHAIGDRANREVLDIFARMPRHPHLRHRIEHGQLLHPADLPRLARLGLVASMQPIHATSDRYMADRHWGKRARYGYAWRSLLKAGTILAFGSDCPVETLDPLQGIYAAVTRKRADQPDEAPWYPEECISVEEAVRAYTWGAAYAAGQEAWLGSITPGKLADMVVLSQDIFCLPPEAILEARVVYTIFAGEVVYGR